MNLDSAQPQPLGYGTFQGVFLPCLLSVFGVVMFLRMGWMVGQVGTATTSFIIALSIAVSFLTALSISATVTNMRVGGGGAYFIISRSLGIEIGTAVGLLLYLAQSLGIAFYLAGFSESIVEILPSVNGRWVAVGMLMLMGIVSYRSSDVMVKIQIPIFILIASGLLVFYIGGLPTDHAPVTKPPQPQVGFWSVLAVFFPAVTGIISGIGLSGQLRNPSKSLPRGILGALAVAAIVFFSIPWILAHRAPAEILREDMLIMAKVSAWKPALLAGLWCAALSSAISAFLSAPRILSALAQDRVIPSLLGRGFKKGDTEPRIATLLTFLIALLGVLAGDLNAIAPVLSMIYLTAFVTLNFSAGIESLIKAPSWRPTFKVPATMSLLGALAATVIMLMIDAGSGLLAIAATILIHHWMLRRKMRTHWGDARQGILVLLAGYAIQRLQEFRIDPHSWKPHFLVMVGSPAKSLPIIRMVEHLNQDAGIVSYATIVAPTTSIERSRDMEQGVRGFLNERKIVGLARVIPATNWQTGCIALINFYGLGKLQPDTIVLGIPSQAADYGMLAEVLFTASRYGRNVLMLRVNDEQPENPHDSKFWERRTKESKRIIVWWGGKRHNASLMIALGYLLQTSDDWHGAELVFQSVVQRMDFEVDARQRLEEFAKRSRIEATTNVLIAEPGVEVLDMIAHQSRDASMVFLGIRVPDSDESLKDYGDYLANFLTATREVPNLALVMAGDEVRLARLFR